MTDVERLLKNTVEELDRLLNAKNVLGDPIEKDGSTVIPIVSYGFGFGAGGTDSPKTGTLALDSAVLSARRMVLVVACHGIVHLAYSSEFVAF